MNGSIDWGFVLSVVLVGLVVVFAALVILIFLVWLMGRIFSAFDRKKKQKALDEQQSASGQAQVAMQKNFVKDEAYNRPPTIDSGISPEIIAAISGAVAVMMNQSGAGAFAIRRVQRLDFGRSRWGESGLMDQLFPFRRR